MLYYCPFLLVPDELIFTFDQVCSVTKFILLVLRLQFLPHRSLPVCDPLTGVDMATVAAADNVGERGPPVYESGQAPLPDDEKGGAPLQTLDAENNLTYNDVDEEPEIHARTWIALAAMVLLNYVFVVALLGPPAVVRSTDSALLDALD